MDHQFAMALAVLGILGFLLWTFRPQAPLVIRLLIAVPAILWLVVYILVEVGRSEPELWTGRAEMSIYTVLIIAVGVYVLLNKPKPNEPVGSPEPK